MESGTKELVGFGIGFFGIELGCCAFKQVAHATKRIKKSFICAFKFEKP